MLKIEITKEERKALERVLKSHNKAYMRERACAIIRFAEGQSVEQIALDGLLQKRRVNTVYEWIRRYIAQGIDGLANRPGRGRKPSFFSSK